MADNQSFHHTRRTEFAHGERRNMDTHHLDEYAPQAFHGYMNSSNTGRDFEQDAGYRDNYNRIISDRRSELPPQGMHQGKGPRSYQRSDERINEDIHQRMTDDPRLDASDIAVKVKEGQVELEGVVSNKIEKYLAEEIGERVSGVRYVQNNLKVRR